MKNPILKRYFKYFSIRFLIGFIIISAFALTHLKAISDYNYEISSLLENENIEFESNDSLIDYDNPMYNSLIPVEYIKIKNTSTYFYTNYYIDLCKNLCSFSLFICAIACITFNIWTFDEEKRDFIKVLPIKKEKIYLYRVLFSALLPCLIFCTCILWTLYFCKYNISYINDIFSSFNYNYICYDYSKEILKNSVTTLCTILCFSTLLPFLNTLFSKPTWSWVIGSIAIFVLIIGLNGFFKFLKLYSIIDSSSFYTYNSVRLFIYNIAHKNLFLIFFSFIFAILGTLSYKIEKNENRKGFFMFNTIKNLSFVLGTFFGGFSFLCFLDNFLSFKDKINNSLAFGSLVVLCGFTISYYIIKKIVELCE